MIDSKIEKIRIITIILFVIIATFFIANSTKLLKKPASIFVVEKGSISFEEPAIRIYNS